VLSSEPAARQWIFSMIETMKKGDLIRMLVTLWVIWHARRKEVQEDVFQSPMATISFVNRFLADLEGCGRPVKWTAPPEGVTKINVDATVAKTACKGAIGVVCRSRDGTYLGASAMVFDGLTHPGTLEALACREALDLASDLLLDPILVASDCLEVIKGLHGEYLGVFGAF
jgi:hypothetical protein